MREPQRPLLLASLLWMVAACGEEVCAGDAECVVESPCRGLRFACEEGSASVEVASAATALPDGSPALGSPGDFVLRNDRIVAVVDAVDHPHYVAPSGGGLLDLAPADTAVDGLDHVFQATGLLPADAAVYTSARTFDGAGFAAVQMRGHLEGHPDQPVVTRWEVRPCEPGVRVRTELLNAEPDPAVWTVTDGWYWGGRSNVPFVPHRGVGFGYPDIELTALTDAFRAIPYLATLPAAGSPVTYACIPCNVPHLDGFHSEDVSAAGLPPRVVPPRDYQVFERFIAVADGVDVARATDVALEARRQLFDEPWVELRGRIDGEGLDGNVMVHVARGRTSDAPERRVPVTQVAPGPDGAFAARVPAAEQYVLTVEAFGRVVEERDVQATADGADAGAIGLDAAAELVVQVDIDGVTDHALVLVHPADDATREQVEGGRPGEGTRCAPLLGAPHGGSPACNRILVEGSATVATPPGRYHVYATAGPFATIDRREVSLEASGRTTATLSLARLDLQPEGTLSADFHVHGGASFDSSIPDHDRVRAFLAAGVQVLASTDHDLVHAYEDAVAALDADARVRVIPGVETTGHILFDLVPGADFPQVIGHWNFWPLPEDPAAPWRGAPWDELAEPGLLMTRVEQAGWPATTGVAQLNHPWDDPDFGRDLGFPRAIGVDTGEPLPTLFHAVPRGASHANSDYHAQEVMNGDRNANHLAHRALWFHLLNEGVLRAGTANSDSHGLTDSVLGTPRNLVWTDTTVEGFDVAPLNAAVRAGRMIGTNGPVVEIETTDASGERRVPSLAAFEPAVGALLHVRVTAAPWVPVEEVRVVVNGETVHTLRDELVHPADPFGTEDLVRFEADLPLIDLIDVTRGDAWLIVEAGRALMPAADLDCDGIPDTGDNDGDGDIDGADVDVTATDETPSPPEPLVLRGCLDEVGPLRNPPVPVDRDVPGYHFAAVVPRGQPASFTNPLVLDLDGGGFSGVAR